MLRRTFLQMVAALPVAGKLVVPKIATSKSVPLPPELVADLRPVTPSPCLTSGKITEWRGFVGKPVYYDVATDSFLWAAQQAVKEGT